MDWTSLVGTTNTAGSLARWLNKSSLSAGAGGDADMIVQEAVGWISGKLRHWQMLTAPTAGTMTVGADQIAVPSDMLEPDAFWIAGNVNGTLYQAFMVQRSPTDVYAMWQFDGTGARVQQQPRFYTFNQTDLQLDSPPDLAYPYFLTYYQTIAALSATNTTNFLTSNYPRLLRTVCMMMGAEWTKENNQGQYDRSYWESQAVGELTAAQMQSDQARRAVIAAPDFSGGGMMYPPYIGNAW